MPLASGSRLGPYAIESPLGSGGMGEVYRARDTRLDRTVAIKVLAAPLTSDPAFRERFEREAKAIAALTHPHICTLYDVGHQDGTNYLVLEYLEGETLADRLQKGALPLDSALKYAIEIADALDKAHRSGFAHRDLKPGNVFLCSRSPTPARPRHTAFAGDAGRRRYADESVSAKLLDFGLAKLARAAPIGIAGMTAAATQSAPLTGHGTILGTLQYMAPEQLEGKDADARTDIFAFGAVLYEMVTSKKAFEGKTQASLIGAILKDDPQPISTCQPLTPPLLDHIVRRCLAKDPDERWQTATDLMRDLKWISDGVAALGVATTAPRTRRRERFAWIVAALALVITAALAVPATLYLRRVVLEPLPTRFEIPTPPTSDPVSFALSADGRQLAFVATAAGAPFGAAQGGPRLWVRPLDQVTAHPLPGTEGASYPFWAPDGRTIGFFADGKLKRIDVGSDGPQVLADAPLVSGEPIPVAQAVGWNAGVLRGAFAVSATGVLAHRASGAERRQLVWVDRAGIARGPVGPPDENGLSSPELAPDGRRGAVHRTVQRNTDVWLIEVGRGVPSRFTFDASNDGFPLWSPDGRRVVFASDDPNGVFDLFEKAASGPGDGQPLLVTADNKNPLAWSPDGRVLLYATQHPKAGADLWALPVAGERSSTRSASSGSTVNTVEPSTGSGPPEPAEGRKPFPVVQTPFEEAAGQFSPDGRWVAYESNESGRVEIDVRPFPGPGGQWQVSIAGGSQPRWRPDGKELFYVAPDARLMVVSIAVGADQQTLEAGAPVPLFPTRLASGSNIPGGVQSKPQYAVASDGRFLMNVAVEGATAPPITVVLNWDAALKK